MTIPLPVLFVIGLFISAKVKYHGIPVLWLIAATVMLLVFAMVLFLLRTISRDGGLTLRYRPVMT